MKFLFFFSHVIDLECYKFAPVLLVLSYLLQSRIINAQEFSSGSKGTVKHQEVLEESTHQELLEESKEELSMDELLGESKEGTTERVYSAVRSGGHM